jgi:SWIM zinc finger.
MRREDPLRRAVDSLLKTFPGKSRNWIKRALMRLGDVREVRENLYLVDGRRELGDWKPLYQVWFSEREGRWYCTCYASAFGFRRRKEICTHIAAVMLYRRYRKALQRLENKRVYVVEAEVECRGRLEADGELYVKPLVEKSGGVAKLTFFVNPKYRIVVVSAHRRIAVKCSSHVIYEAEGEEVPMAVARFLVEKLYEGEE